MQTNDDDMVVDYPVSVCECQMQIEGDDDCDEHAMDEDLDQGFCNEDLDQGFCNEDLDQGFDQGFDEDLDQGFDQGFAYEAIDPDGFDYNQGFAQSEIHIEFPEGASIRFAFVNGVRYLVLTNM